jgi:hypothetical protein
MGKSIAQRSRKVTEGDWDWWPNIFGEWPELPGENHVNGGKASQGCHGGIRIGGEGSPVNIEARG